MGCKGVELFHVAKDSGQLWRGGLVNEGADIPVLCNNRNFWTE